MLISLNQMMELIHILSIHIFQRHSFLLILHLLIKYLHLLHSLKGVLKKVLKGLNQQLLVLKTLHHIYYSVYQPHSLKNYLQFYTHSLFSIQNSVLFIQYNDLFLFLLTQLFLLIHFRFHDSNINQKGILKFLLLRLYKPSLLD